MNQPANLADAQLLIARLENLRGQVRLLRAELRDLIGDLHRLGEAITNDLPPEGTDQ